MLQYFLCSVLLNFVYGDEFLVVEWLTENVHRKKGKYEKKNGDFEMGYSLN